jgi:predicted esterase
MSFLRDEEDCPEQPTAPTTTDGTSTEITVLLNQVLLFLHGMGGSGKSLAVHAMIALAMSWDRPRAILTSAKSGVAAVNVEGYTVDSLRYKPKSFFDEVRMLISHT